MRIARFGVAVSAVCMLLGCNRILGIEKLQSAPSDAHAGSGGTSSQLDAGVQAAAADSGGATAGTSGAAAGNSQGGSGGSGGHGGATEAVDAGAGVAGSEAGGAGGHTSAPHDDHDNHDDDAGVAQP